MTDALRSAAFARVRRLQQVCGDDIPWGIISQGFECNGEKILLASKPVGIFKPKQLLRGALSIRTSKPRVGRKNVYADSEDADGTFVYSLQGKDPNNHFNRALHECLEDQLPLIYFHAITEGVYAAIFPCFIESIDVQMMTCRVAIAPTQVGKNDAHLLSNADAKRVDRRYVFREAKARLHQAEFRRLVLAAYGSRCAMTGLSVPEMLEAAHIVPDAHELGVAEVNNGICLSCIHHRALDANLIGVTPDYKVRVSERLLNLIDGEGFWGDIKALHGRTLTLPNRKKSWPSKSLLELRFGEFEKWVRIQ